MLVNIHAKYECSYGSLIKANKHTLDISLYPKLPHCLRLNGVNVHTTSYDSLGH